MKRERFYISLSPEKWLLFYKGQYQKIVVSSYSGLRISIPARNFVPFANFSGIRGTFEITFDEKNKIVGMRKVF